VCIFYMHALDVLALRLAQSEAFGFWLGSGCLGHRPFNLKIVVVVIETFPASLNLL